MMDSDGRDEHNVTQSLVALKPIKLSVNIYHLPPELWAKIFDCLELPTDLLNVSKAVSYWREVLHSTKSAWLFSMVFPMLMEHLSKQDILNCRQVCKRWCSGVEYFLENNAFQRPAFMSPEHLKNWYATETTLTEERPKTDFRYRPLLIHLATKKLMYKYFPDLLKIKFLTEAASYKRCHIVGRSICLAETSRSFPDTNVQFLKVFGYHIWFMRIGIVDLSPIDILTRTLDLITLCPNLKKLDIYGTWIPLMPRAFHTDDMFQERQLSLYVESRYATEIMRESLPKLETLDVELTGPCHMKVKEILVSLFCTPNLQSLAMNLMPIPPHLEVANLADLSISLDSDTQLTHLLQLKAPLRRLGLHLSGSVSPKLLFEVITRFQSTIRQIGLNIHPQFYMQLLSIQLPENLLPFKNPDVLQGLCIKTICIKGCQPVSFNYLYGLRKHLEYLHLYIENFDQWEQKLEDTITAMVNAQDEPETEVLDLLQLLKILPDSSKLKMYESNVWIVFPRLKVLTIMLWKDGDTVAEDKKVEWEYRRDVYEKMKRNL